MIALHLKQNEKKKMGSGVKVAFRFGSLVGLLCCIAKILERNCIVRWQRCGCGEGLLLVIQDDAMSPQSVSHKKSKPTKTKNKPKKKRLKKIRM